MTDTHLAILPYRFMIDIIFILIIIYRKKDKKNEIAFSKSKHNKI